ncbi:uncharacterized protein KY384_001094 [Bacidia gigantensis]|uniref:uncharacterized protein n=1 Tax=Bacidia gigantensis TaxID=2732470 RepID=UPI001D03BECB|nr:uncharacterized protein KY384_001094 [Bacidia gigantensis]KAG8534250.1 hypothetical protein KY384_001094 [Bacidia gigantensis]
MEDENHPGNSSADISNLPNTFPTNGLPDNPAASGMYNGHDETATGSPNENNSVVDSVLRSDIGVNTLLTRLKQSVASAREFATFLKKRSTLEEDQAQGLKKLCRGSHDAVRRPDNRQGSYARSYEETVRVHDRMADNGIQFALSLHHMHEDLNELAVNIERGRKMWKQNGLAAEKRVQDSEALMEKAKAKYHSLAEDYDRARTGDKGSGRVFGLKGPKSAAQHEEDLSRKVQQADADYSSKVQTAKAQRQDLVSTLRPQATKALQELINECDNGLTLQLQKFASFNERLLLGNGLCVCPLPSQPDSLASRSLREVISQIDNPQDLRTFIVSHASKVSDGGDIKYERHPTLKPEQANPPSLANRTTPPMQGPGPAVMGGGPHRPSLSTPTPSAPGGTVPTQAPMPVVPFGALSGQQSGLTSSPQTSNYPTSISNAPPQLPPAQIKSPLYPQPPASLGTFQNNISNTSLPALRPVFGLSLDDLLKRDGSAVPLVIYQCIQAIDLFGLEVEGIYRLSGSSTHVNKLKGIFDNDSTQVDFRNPEAFYHDVNSVAGLLKQFFRDLPDPLLTREHYQGFVDAARIDDSIMRRDSIHAIINALPDPNYATLRALTLHLNRVQEHSAANRMNASNLAIIFGPTLMGSGPDVADAGWQVRAIDTILQNTYQIFDDD